MLSHHVSHFAALGRARPLIASGNAGRYGLYLRQPHAQLESYSKEEDGVASKNDLALTVAGSMGLTPGQLRPVGCVLVPLVGSTLMWAFVRFTAGVDICRVPLRSRSRASSLLPTVPADGLGAGGAPELLGLVFPGGSPVPGTAAPGAGVDGGAHPRGVSGMPGPPGQGPGQGEGRPGSQFAIPLGLVITGGRKSSVVLTPRWKQRDSSSPTAMAGRSWRGGGVTGGTQEWTVVCGGPWRVGGTCRSYECGWESLVGE